MRFRGISPVYIVIPYVRRNIYTDCSLNTERAEYFKAVGLAAKYV